MNLLVIRHAIAMKREQFSVVCRNDDLRPVTPEGLRKMRSNARGLSRIATRPALLLTSPLTRAQQTTEVLCGKWRGLRPLTCDLLRPGGDPMRLAKQINAIATRKRALGKTVAIVGHEPHLSMLIAWLLGGSRAKSFELKKGGACLLEARSTLVKGRACLLWTATPSILRLV